jgi:hypothetical protein
MGYACLQEALVHFRGGPAAPARIEFRAPRPTLLAGSALAHTRPANTHIAAPPRFERAGRDTRRSPRSCGSHLIDRGDLRAYATVDRMNRRPALTPLNGERQGFGAYHSRHWRRTAHILESTYRSGTNTVYPALTFVIATDQLAPSRLRLRALLIASFSLPKLATKRPLHRTS